MSCPPLTPLPPPTFIDMDYKPGQVVYIDDEGVPVSIVSEEPSPPLTDDNFYNNISKVEI